VIRILWLFTFFIDHDLTVFTTNNKTLGIYTDALDVESFTGALTKEHLVITRAFKKHNLSLICANNQTAIWHPGMASKVV
jgi:hypothetical protein